MWGEAVEEEELGKKCEILSTWSAAGEVSFPAPPPPPPALPSEDTIAGTPPHTESDLNKQCVFITRIRHVVVDSHFVDDARAPPLNSGENAAPNKPPLPPPLILPSNLHS